MTYTDKQIELFEKETGEHYCAETESEMIDWLLSKMETMERKLDCPYCGKGEELGSRHWL